MGRRFYKHTLAKFLIILSFSSLEVSAFDLADYAKTHDDSKVAYQAAMATLSAKESAFRMAYNARITLERVNKVAEKEARMAEKQAAIDSGNSAAESAAQEAIVAAQAAIDALDEMKVNSNACGLY